jgi:ATPase subunit of ABC transporter with duplicated ATPase domains
MATRILLASLLVLNLRITPHEAFVTVSSRSAFQQQRRSSSSSSNTISSSSLHSTKPSAAADARGAAVLLEQVSVFRGPNAVLQNIDWRIEPRTKWALVGSNGAGKSTLLKALVNELQYEGRIILSQQEDIGYLQQTAVAGSNKTVYEEAAAGMKEVNKARLEMEAAMEREDMEAYQKALTRFEALDGYKQDGVIANVLNGLGFTNFDIRCDELSGGWQMRVAFARLLLSEPKLCLMDEPGNHLDSAAKKWLARYLAEYQGEGSMILVTHDVELLQSMDHIAEIIPEATNSLQIYKSCTYNQYLELKEQRAAAAVAEFERNAEKAAKLQSFVDRWGAKISIKNSIVYFSFFYLFGYKTCRTKTGRPSHTPYVFYHID